MNVPVTKYINEYTVRADIHGQNNQRHSIIKSKTIFYSGKGTLHCRRDRI